MLAAAGSGASSTVVADAAVAQLVRLDPTAEVAPKSRARRLREAWLKRPSMPKLAINILLWWALNVVFSLSNKQCLNSWPHPWALACSHLAVGSLCMLPLYLPLPRSTSKGSSLDWVGRAHPRTRRTAPGPQASPQHACSRPACGGAAQVPTRPTPRLTHAEVSTLLPVAALLSVGHVTSTLAPAYGTVAFSNIVKTAEPLFTCACSMVLYRRARPSPPRHRLCPRHRLTAPRCASLRLARRRAAAPPQPPPRRCGRRRATAPLCAHTPLPPSRPGPVRWRGAGESTLLPCTWPF